MTDLISAIQSATGPSILDDEDVMIDAQVRVWKVIKHHGGNPTPDMVRDIRRAVYAALKARGHTMTDLMNAIQSATGPDELIEQAPKAQVALTQGDE